MYTKMKLLYLGNKTLNYSRIASVIDTLEPLLAEFCEIKTASDKRNVVLRFLDMLVSFFRYGLSADELMIDVYSSRAFNYAFVLGCLCCVFGKPYILFLHGGNLPVKYGESCWRYQFLFKNAFKIVAPSPYLASFFIDKGFRIEVIPNSIDIDKYTFVKRRHVRPRMIALRGFGKAYNPLMTLRCVQLLLPVYPNLKLLMVGDSKEYFYSQVKHYIATEKLENFVDVVPKMTRKEWCKVSEDYDIMISNPTVDNTPVSLIEGMALGLCCISTNVGGIPFLVSNNEVALVESNNVNEMYGQIEKILNNCDYAESLSSLGRQKAEEFDWKNIQRRWRTFLST